MTCAFCHTENPDNTEFCASCGMRLGATPEGASLVSEPSAALPDWDVRGHTFNPVSFLISLREILFTPSETFRRLKPDNLISNALLFGLIGGTLGGFASAFWHYAVSVIFGKQINNPFYSYFGETGMVVALLFFIPLLNAIGLFVMSGIFHFCLMLLGGANRTYATTFKVYAYNQGATALLGIIPVLGSGVGFLWSVALNIIGLREAHQTNSAKSLMAVLLPFLLCCGCIGFGILLMLLMGLSVLPWLSR